MTEPDNEHAFQEAVRQRLADFRPPLNPDHWQRMRRQLRQEQVRRVVRQLAIILLIVGLGGYVVHLALMPPKPLSHLPSSTKSDSVKHISTPPQGSQHLIRPLVSNHLPLKRVMVQLPAVFTGRMPAVLPLDSRPLPPIHLPAFPEVRPVAVPSPAEADIIKRVTTGNIGSDSTSYRVLSRNIKKWSKAVLVCDFTSSMYPYSTQLMNWFRKNETNRQVQGLVFFTDCDSLGQETGPGRPGQLFTTRNRSIQAVLPLMLASARNTMGNKAEAENDIEALVYAQQQFPDAAHLVLIADNSSPVKDMDRLAELHKPVHIILCGPAFDTTRAFHPDYYTIAQQSGGSLHTLEDDLSDVAHLKPATWIRVAGHYYRLNRRGRFVLTSFRHRPKRLLGLFWY